ncbi:hypothetical protein BH09ACT7_BH09ACT7_18380 [soil metagenome]
MFVDDGHVELLVPQLVVDEFDRNRANVEKTMTTSLTDRFKAIRQELMEYADMDYRNEELRLFDRWAHQVTTTGALTTRNFDDIRALLAAGKRLEPTGADHERVVARGLAKAAPFHRSGSSVADALLIEMYGTASANPDGDDTYAFVTTNSADFSAAQGDNRLPHADLAALFSPSHSSYWLGVDGLEGCLREEFGDYLEQVQAEEFWSLDGTRGLDEILAAEREMFDRVWYDRSMLHEHKALDEGNLDEAQRIRRIAGPARTRVEETYGVDNLGPYDKFEWGMINGKLSALRWVLGDDWDFLDT